MYNVHSRYVTHASNVHTYILCISTDPTTRYVTKPAEMVNCK